MSLPRIAIAGSRSYPPRVTAFTAPFWEGLASGSLVTTRCTSCGEASFPPKPVCPYCWRGEVEWFAVRPEGRLYAWTRVHAGPAVFESELPYEVGVVDLDCGIRLACRLYGDTEWACDMPVELAVLEYEDGPLLAARIGRQDSR